MRGKKERGRRTERGGEKDGERERGREKERKERKGLMIRRLSRRVGDGANRSLQDGERQDIKTLLHSACTSNRKTVGFHTALSYKYPPTSSP